MVFVRTRKLKYFQSDVGHLLPGQNLEDVVVDFEAGSQLCRRFRWEADLPILELFKSQLSGEMQSLLVFIQE
jgi:hypothetical protein